MLLLEARKLASPFEEVDECLVEMTQALLERNRGHLSQPGRLRLCFPEGQEGRKIVRGEALPRFPVGRRLFGECLIVDPATTPKRSGKHQALLGGGGASIVI